ncbi:beta-3-deoxy-D-manno-oct-2-ulosonic acid transferase [Sphingomonas sp. CROZ-RG-20F-R02-07]|uniref:capsular polysaccharide export protein, LipB/KpsS family n=1 Tax=Sphingomonas sp. CROZ-RG-20F-R02-07 TaxID=2914832 RepID=UPI001F5653B5|nr:beta-3-deoxy-D-manno-oct-2-ulosonic acid transferase [Sphingomonas sp. CROZ-RG-20F-R02-07]
MATEPPPLLRAPPFLGITPAIAAVSAPPATDAPAQPQHRSNEPQQRLQGAAPASDDPQVEAILAAVRTARVGGTFWAAPVHEQADTIVRARRGEAPRDIPATALRLAGEADPWSVLAPGVTLVAHGDDEWVAIAAIAGADVRLLSPGRFGAPGEAVGVLRRRVAAHLRACRYRDPFAGEACSLEETLALLVLWRDQIAANRAIVAAAGMAWWKRAEIRRFLWAPRASRLPFLSGVAAVRRAARTRGSVAVWPSRITPEAVAEARRRGVALVQVEDGFVRSVGLGANLVPPLSVTVDRLGIHYDPSRPSELERMLEAGGFPPALLARAAALRARIVADRISKYGSGDEAALPVRMPGRRLVLVPGQVEDDRSVLLGGGAVAGNLDLLRRARRAEPEAEIWFRPHPDVDAGHRKGGLGDADALAYVDRVVRGGSMAALLAEVDAVHVLTSLTGFEALLRGREVVCHGVPFFAGWGLTRDLAPVPDRRTRRLALDELVTATLILYPRYLDPVTLLPCPPETLVTRIAQRPEARSGPLVRLRQLQGRLMRRF